MSSTSAMNALTQVVRRKLIKPKKASLTRPYSTPSKKPYLLVGLGNPGSEYQHTRHNIGFLAIEHIAKEHNIKLSRSKFNSIYGGKLCARTTASKINGNNLNNNGVQYRGSNQGASSDIGGANDIYEFKWHCSQTICRLFQAGSRSMVISCSTSIARHLTISSVVMFDNIHLPLGDIRMRPKGSSGGQNGVKHIIEQLNTEQFPRLAMGVGPVPKVHILMFITRVLTSRRKISSRLY